MATADATLAPAGPRNLSRTSRSMRPPVVRSV